MAEADKVRINGAQFDRLSTDLKIGGEPIYGYTGATWKQSRTRAKGNGHGKDGLPKGRTRGSMTYETLKLTVRRDTASVIKLQLAERSGDGESYGDPDDVPIVLQYIEDESNQQPVVVEFGDCALVSDNGNVEEEGPDMVEIEFDYMSLDETINGKRVRMYSAR